MFNATPEDKGLMPHKKFQVTNVTAAQTPAAGALLTAMKGRKSIEIRNDGSADVVVGFRADMTTSAYKRTIPAGQSWSIDADDTVAIYYISAGACDLEITEAG